MDVANLTLTCAVCDLCVAQNGHKVVSKRENWQNRYFAIVDGSQPHIAWYKDQKDFQSGKSAQGTMDLRQATAHVVLGVDSSSLLPRQFEVETPGRNLIAKTLEGQDATARTMVAT